MNDHELAPNQVTTTSVDSGIERARSVRDFAWQELGHATESMVLNLSLGTTRMPREHQRQLRKGSVVTLDNPVDEPVEITAGKDVLGYGRVVIMDGKFAVQVTEVRSQSRRRSA